MPKDSPFYAYRPLDFKHGGFRVATLHPTSNFSAPICCDLVEVTLSNHQDYEAISYVWGDPEQQASLRVEGAELRVTANLALALRYLRYPDEPRTLWADAICIDQKNIEERNQQVQLMKDIYSSCRKDLIWLGEASQDTENGVAGLMRMKSLNLHRFTNRGRKEFSDKAAIRELGSTDSYALIHIIRGPSLWSRVWVMQEIACCPEAVLVIGRYIVPWTILSSILDHSGIPDRYHLPFSHQGFDDDVWDAFAPTQVIEHQRDILKGTSPLNSTLLDVLSRFRSTCSTDPRDKIYGLLGLATDNLPITPDYKKPVRDVYIEVARAQINASQNLDMITQSLWPLGHTAKVYRTDLDLPSWCPDFSATEPTKILFAQRNIFMAGPATCPHPVTIGPAGVLTISGAVLATVKTLKPSRQGRIFGAKSILLRTRAWLPDGLFDNKLSIPRNFNYPTGGDAFEAYWRTLMTDCVAYPSRRLEEADIEEFGRLFGDWRMKIGYSAINDGDGNETKREYFLDAIGKEGTRAAVGGLISKWRFAELDGGLFGMVPADEPYDVQLEREEGFGGEDTGRGTGARVGDVVVVIPGGKVPILLRENDSDEANKTWKLIETAYVHGFMDGLATEWVGKGLLEERTFDVV